MNEVAEVNKESYIRTKLDITVFDTKDVIVTSNLIEVDPGQTGGGTIGEPQNFVLNR